MKILIADKFPEFYVEAMKRTLPGAEVILDAGLKAEDLAEAAREAQILVVRGTKVPGEAIRNARDLNLIIRAGAGFDTIDVATASELGVYVANCPGKNSVAVAELAIGLMLAIDRRLYDNTAELKNHRWNKKEYSRADGIYGKTLGIIGLGRIAREVILRAKALGMHVVAWSRSLTPEHAETLDVRYAATPLAVAEQADVVSVHVALKPETRQLINGEFLSRMKDRAILINTARGGVVDEQALLKALNDKGLRAGLDVFADEPAAAAGEFAAALMDHPNVYGSHHIGASTDQAQNAIAAETVRIIRSFVETGEVPNSVNLCAKSPARVQLNVRHFDRVGVLAGVLTTLKEADINVEEMENVVFAGAKAACAKIRLDSVPDPAVLEKIRGDRPNIIRAELVMLPGGEG